MLAVDDIPVAALQTGESTAPPVLLVPGYTGSKEDFGPLLDPLAAAGFRRPRSTCRASSSRRVRPSRRGTRSRAGCDRAGPRAPPRARVRLLGHSFGGLVSRAAVCAEPQAFASLVLVGSGPAALQGPRRIMIERLEPVLASQGMSAVYAATQAVAAAQPGYRRAVPGARAPSCTGASSPAPPRCCTAWATRFAPSPTGWTSWPRPASRSWCSTGREMMPGCRRPSGHGRPPARSGRRHPGAMHSPAIDNPAATIEALLQFWA